MRRLAASFGGAGVTVTSVTYTSPTSLTLTVNTVGRDCRPADTDGDQSRRPGDPARRRPDHHRRAPVNQPPVAVNDAGSTPFGAVLNVPAPGVLANDVDPEGQPLSAELVASAAHGS